MSQNKKKSYLTTIGGAALLGGAMLICTGCPLLPVGYGPPPFDDEPQDTVDLEPDLYGPPAYFMNEPPAIDSAALAGTTAWMLTPAASNRLVTLTS